MTSDVISLARKWITFKVIIVIVLALLWITKAGAAMGKLLYFDGLIAICEFNIEQRADERTIKLLLEVDSENPDVEKHVKPLLECWNVAHFLSYSLLSDADKADIVSNADVDALQQLGFEIDGGFIRHKSEFMPSISLEVRMLISVSQAVERIRGLATYLQYLAKLHLLSKGNAEFESILPDIQQGEHGLEFKATLPAAFLYNIIRFTLATTAVFDADKAESFGNNYWFSVPVTLPYVDMLRFPRSDIEASDAYSDDMNTPTLPNDAFELKRIAASFLLTSLINYQSAHPFSTDYETLALKRSDSDSFASTLADLMIDGKIRSCPHCSRPILVKRDKGMMYCSASCRTLYNRKAKEMCGGGASVDEVHASFPAIPKETIRGWLPMEGR